MLSEPKVKPSKKALVNYQNHEAAKESHRFEITRTEKKWLRRVLTDYMTHLKEESKGHVQASDRAKARSYGKLVREVRNAMDGTHRITELNTFQLAVVQGLIGAGLGAPEMFEKEYALIQGLEARLGALNIAQAHSREHEA